jgi:hypothetical protein
LNSSWSGVHDGSDGSDDSSNGDHFFAVGKDLATAIDSRYTCLCFWHYPPNTPTAWLEGLVSFQLFIHLACENENEMK